MIFQLLEWIPGREPEFSDPQPQPGMHPDPAGANNQAFAAMIAEAEDEMD